jgi:hypothetical protein
MVAQIDNIKPSSLIATTPHDAKMSQAYAKETESKEDRVTLTEQQGTAETYGPSASVGSSYELLRDLVTKAFEDQGVQFQIANGERSIDLTEVTSEEAQELVSEDGFFGVEKTSQRIVDFALNAFGDDPERLQEMKDAINQGFKAAEEAFGGTLPDISHQTYVAVMEKLDAFSDQPAGNEE